MSKIVVPMFVSITEEYYQEFIAAMEDKGFVTLPFESSEGMLSVQISKINYEV